MSNSPIPDHALIGRATEIPTTTATPVFSISPIVLKVPGRLVDLQIKLSAPTIGNNLPIILLSHGQGQSNHLSSLHGYGPLVNFWAGHGFAVIQPTHLSSKTLKLEDSAGPMFWRSRVEDMKHIIDQKQTIEEAVEGIRNRLDWSRIAIVGHSMGGHTAGVLLGAGVTDPETKEIINLKEPRIKAGVMLTAPGADRDGGATQSEMARKVVPFFVDPVFETMTTPTLVVEADGDEPTYLTTRGMQWHRDPYTLSTGPKSLLTVHGAGHILGGISGWDAAECDDENVERASTVERLTWAYLRSALYPEDLAWSVACNALKGLNDIGKVESK